MDSQQQPEVASVGGEVPRSIWSIIVDVFVSPTRAFADFSRKPRVLIPLILLILLTVVTGYFTNEYSSKMVMEMMKNATKLPPEAMDAMQKSMATQSIARTVMNMVGGALMVTIMGLVAALVSWFLGSFVFGGQSKFLGVWGVTLLGSLIPLSGGLLRVPLMIAKDSIYVSFGLAALFPDKDFTSFMYSFLYQLDIFAIWSIIVTGIGYAAIFRLSRGRGMAVSVIVALLFTLISISMQLLGWSAMGIKITFF